MFNYLGKYLNNILNYQFFLKKLHLNFEKTQNQRVTV